MAARSLPNFRSARSRSSPANHSSFESAAALASDLIASASAQIRLTGSMSSCLRQSLPCFLDRLWYFLWVCHVSSPGNDSRSWPKPLDRSVEIAGGRPDDLILPFHAPVGSRSLASATVEIWPKRLWEPANWPSIPPGLIAAIGGLCRQSWPARPQRRPGGVGYAGNGRRKKRPGG